MTSAAVSAEREIWLPDLLDGFERRRLDLTSAPLPGEPEVVATLVRRSLQADPDRDTRTRAVLSVPGFNDYFFHPHVAAALEAAGWTFYALDPRRLGRSITTDDYRSHVNDLSEYFEEYDLAVAELARRHEKVVLMGHSTGGLVSALYAAARPGRLAGLVLNAPWLAMWGGGAAQLALAVTVGVQARKGPLSLLNTPEGKDFYAQSLHASMRGEWDYDLRLKFPGQLPIRAGWAQAIGRGQRRVARGLAIEVPIFMAASDQSLLAPQRWTEKVRSRDTVLDVENLCARAPKLGRSVTLVRVKDAGHDITLSAEPVRRWYLDQVCRWLSAYVG